jgi:cysteine desulfurase family protein
MIYFDNAATTYPKPPDVYKKAMDFFQNYGFNAGRSDGGLKTTEIITKARRGMLKLLDGDGTHDAVFSPSATIALNVVLQGIDYSNVKNVYISPFEHNAVMRTLHVLAKEKEFLLHILEVNKNPLVYDVGKIENQFTSHSPDMVVISHSSNVLGIIAPVKEIFTLAKGYKAITVCDMAQTAGLVETSVKDCQIDIAIFAGHKTLLAFTGVAGFLLRKGFNLKPLYYGGTGRMSEQIEMPNQVPDKFEAGSPDILAIASLYYSLKWIADKTVKALRKAEETNFTKLKTLIQKYPNIKVIGDSENSTGILSCVFDSYSPDNIGQILSERNIAVRSGLHCSPNSHKFLGTFPAGTVRFSVNCFNSESDFVALEEALNYIEENT